MAEHAFRYFLEFGMAWDWGAPAEYIRPWWSQERFYEHSSFLPTLNNEFAVKNPVFKERLSNVKNFALWRWKDE